MDGALSVYHANVSAKYNINHALTFIAGGFVTLHHNEIVNVTADMLSMVCKDVRKEPTLSATPQVIRTNTMEDNGKPEKKKIQTANRRWLKWLFHFPYIYNQWWNEQGTKQL